MRLIFAFLTMAAFLSGETDTLHITAASTAYQTGQAAAHDKKYQQAIDLFHQAIEIEPTFKEAYKSLIDANLNAGRSSDAAAAITQLLEIDPEITHYRITLGKILAEQNQTERALAQFSFVLKADPLNADALLGFAGAAEKMGMKDRAADALERGRRQYPLDERFSAKTAAAKAK